MVDKFLRYLQVEKNTSPLTVKNYAADISLFSNFLAERLGKDFQWQKIGVLDIRAYLVLLNKEKYARTTIARRISSLRSFYKFLMRENYVEQNPFVKVRTPKLEKRLPVFLEELEINEILTLPDKDTLGLRDQAILELLYATGCRVSELVGLTVTNIDLGSQYVLLLGFAVKWYQTAFLGCTLGWKNIFPVCRRDFLSMGLLAGFFLLNLAPVLSFYLLLIREPNPDAAIEVAYFACVSVGFLVPFAVMRFYSLFGLAVEGCRLPSWSEVWQLSRGNTLRILIALFFIFFLTLFAFLNFYLLMRGYETQSTLWLGISSEFVYDLMLLMLLSLFIMEGDWSFLGRKKRV